MILLQERLKTPSRLTQKFCTLYMDALRGLIDLSTLDYLIVSHTEPDHSGLVANVLELAPQATIVGAKVAIQFLENMVHCPFQSQVVKQGDRLDLSQGHELEFISAPNLHWPDTIFTYDVKTQTLFTCDAFGMHYYDCLMGPNARSVLAAIKRMEPLAIELIATGLGPLLKHHRTTWVNCYRAWSLNALAFIPTLIRGG